MLKRIKEEGATHVDWAISFGVFLVAVITILIFLKPGVKEIYNDQTMLNLLQDKVSDRIMWEVKKTPLFIDALEVSHDNIDILIKVSVRGGWRFSKIEPDAYGSFIFDLGASTFEVRCNIGICETADGKPIMLYYYPLGYDYEIPHLNFKCSINDDESCSGYLGSTENFVGFDMEKLDKLKKENYEDIKKDFGMPDNKDFAVYLGDEKIIGLEPGQQDNVFAREIKTWILDKYSEREYSVLSLRVW